MKRIAIIYERSNKIGQGHYFRSKRLFSLIKKKFKTKIFRIIFNPDCTSATCAETLEWCDGSACI